MTVPYIVPLVSNQDVCAIRGRSTVYVYFFPNALPHTSVNYRTARVSVFATVFFLAAFRFVC